MTSRPLRPDCSHRSRLHGEQLGLGRVAAALKEKEWLRPLTLRCCRCCSDVYPRISGVRSKDAVPLLGHTDNERKKPTQEALRELLGAQVARLGVGP